MHHVATGQKIKVCHVTSVHKAADNHIFFKECRALAKEYDVTLMAPAAGNYISHGVQIITLPQPVNRLYRFFITDTAILFKALAQKAALYHLHDPELIIAGLVLHALGKKVVYDIHEDVVTDLEEKKWLPVKPFFRRVFIFFENLALKRFHLVLAEQSYADKYQDRAADFVVVQNFVPLADLPGDAAYNSLSDTIVLAGMLSARRGLPFILQALHILKQRGLLIRLRCIGSRDPAVDDILNASDAWPHVKELVEFKGYIPFPQSLDACRDCMAGLALPETLPNHLRSYPTKMFEYMAIGLPVIASDFPLYKEVVEKYDCGLTVTPENSEAIANAISGIYYEKDTAMSMSRNGMEAAKNFNWEPEAEKLRAFYKRILH